MKVTNPKPAHKLSFYTICALLIALGLSACSNPMEVESVEEEPPPPAPAQLYQVAINFTEIDIKADCDADNKVLGVPVVNQGEIAYQTGYSFQRADGSWTGITSFAQSSGYGARGEHKKYKSGETININRTKTLTLEEGLNYRIHVRGIEWDGRDKDSRLNGSDWGTEENNTGAPRLNHVNYINIGSSASSCRLQLKAETTETPL